MHRPDSNTSHYNRTVSRMELSCFPYILLTYETPWNAREVQLDNQNTIQGNDLQSSMVYNGLHITMGTTR